MNPSVLPHYAPTLLAWFDQHGRHDLPWTQPRTPYRVWLSEIMLQQTQVVTVIPYFNRFIAQLPDLPSLAQADPDTVLALWSGLGYYSRARNLHAAARICMEMHDGELPDDFDALLALPGIGRSTAGAILAQAHGAPYPILDGNVKRVLSRLHAIEGWPGSPAVEKQLWQIAQRSLPNDGQRMADYTQAQMDLGATLCTRSKPDCVRCPLNMQCLAHQQARTSELPSKRPRKALPERGIHMLWLRDEQGRTLLQRRPPAGVWPSLWSLPEHEEMERLIELAKATLAHTDTAQALPAIRHTFSHFHLQIQPWRIEGHTATPHVSEAAEHLWAAPSQLETLGIPAPVRKLIEETP